MAGGRVALWELVSMHLESQQHYERAARLNGLTALFLLVPVGAAAWLARNNGNPHWEVLYWIAISIPLLAALQWLVTRVRIQRLYNGAEELQGYIRNVIFEYELWYDLMAGDQAQELKLGPIELAKRERSFNDRVQELFKNYPALAGRKHLEPFPGWYRKMYRSGSQRNNQYVDHFWQYALAEVLKEEFFTSGPY